MDEETENESNKSIEPSNRWIDDMDTDSLSEDKSETNYFKKNEIVHEGPAILAPDHPLLVKFQRHLKEHLTRQLERYNDEVIALEVDCKKKDAKREELGLELYELQNEVVKQQDVLSTYMESLDELSTLRNKMEDRIEKEKNIHKELSEALELEIRKQNGFRLELEETSRLECQLLEWEKMTQDELAVNQRMADKDQIEKQRLIEEQKQLDIIMYNITTEVQKLEAEKCILELQLEKLNVRMDDLQQSSADANADYQALHREQSRLLQLWSGVVVNIQQRDNLLINCRQDLQEQARRVRAKSIEILGYKKATQAEMEENEMLMLQKSRAEFDLSNIERQVQSELMKMNAIEKEMAHLNTAVEQTDKELTKATYDLERLRQVNMPLQREADKHARIKIEIEEQMMNLLRDQITNDKAAQYLAKKYHEKQQQSRAMEIVLNNQENQLAQITLNIENWRSLNCELKTMLEALTKEYNEADKYVNSLGETLEKNEQLQCRRQRAIDTLNRRLDALIENAGHPEEQNDHELKLQDMEKSIRDAEDKTHKLEIIWLRLQGHIVTLATKRSDQQQLMHNLRRQLLIMEHKSVKLNKELNTLRSEDQNMTKRIANMVARLEVVNVQLMNRRGFKTDSLKQCQLTQVEFSKKLLDSEMFCANLEQQINDLHNEISELEDILMNKQKEALSWDGMVRHATENIQNYKAEMKQGNDLTGMRAEIHRMQVRLANLKQISDKLVHDLDNCVSQRSSIVDKSEIRDKKGDSNKSRKQLATRIQDTKLKIKKIKKEIRTYENKSKHVSEECEIFMRDLEDIKAAQKMQEIEEAHLEEEFIYCQLMKSNNSERIILKQHRAKKIAQLQDHHIQQLSLRNDAIASSLDHQNKMNNNLLEICHILKQRYPQYKHQFNRIINTLRKRETVSI